MESSTYSEPTKESRSDLIEALVSQAFKSSAANHSYLEKLSLGQFPDMEWALQDFATQYGFYSRHFIKYVETVVSTISNQSHKAILLNNIAEENGEQSTESDEHTVSESHQVLFARFQQAVGANALEPTPYCPGSIWSDRFLAICKSNSVAGIGALGIATEMLVGIIYQKILLGIKNHTKLPHSAYLFFEVHCDCDEEHAKELITIAEQIENTQSANHKLRVGVETALRCRADFWSAMEARATNNCRG